MQQHLLHVAAKHGAAVVEPPGDDVWDVEGNDASTSRVVELQMQGFSPTKDNAALLPPSFTPSAPL